MLVSRVTRYKVVTPLTLVLPVILYSNKHDVYLHCTSSVAALEVTIPTLLFAAHRYSPLSVLLTIVIVNSLLSAPKLILRTLLVNTEPFLVHDIVGTGFPLALQNKVTLSLSVTGPP